jgi:hypothetical protein
MSIHPVASCSVYLIENGISEGLHPESYDKLSYQSSHIGINLSLSEYEFCEEYLIFEQKPIVTIF